MKFQFQQAVRALILLAFCTMIYKLHETGEITKFINPKYETLSQTAAILFFILFLIQLTRIFTTSKHCHHEEHHCNHDHGDSPFKTKKLVSYMILSLPLFTGFLLPARALDASIAEKKGAMLILTNQSQTSITQETSDKTNNGDSTNSDIVDQILLEEKQDMKKDEFELLIKHLAQSPKVEMNDYNFSSYYMDINKNMANYLGKEINLKGFIFKEEGMAQNQLVLSRFLITHCVADASTIGFLSELPEASTLEEDTWIEAQGIIETTTYDGAVLPIIKITNWHTIAEPSIPYLYPINILIL